MVKLAAGVIARVLCYRRQLFWLALMLFPTIATAKVSWEQEWGTRISSRQSVAPLTSDLFGEEVSLYDGTTSFVATDVSIPGNFDIPVAISRRAKLGVPGGSSPQELFGEWEIELPYLKGMYGDDPSSYWKTLGPDGNARCSVGVIPGWGSNALSLPGGGGGLLLKRIDTPKHVRPQQSGLAPWVTKSNWYFTCLPTIQSGQGGEGFVGIAPDGKRYYFDWMTVHNYPGTTTPAMKAGSQIPVPRKEIRLYPTKIEDRFGNKVEYRWTGRHLDSITSSDGRRIDLYYGSNDQVERVIAHGRTWNYAYATAARLQEVVNPDQSRWRYVNEIPSLIGYRDEYESYNCRDTGMVTCDWRLKLDQIMFCQWSDAIKSTPYTFEITAPSGASGKFTFQSMRHGRTNVPRECQVVNGEDGDAANDVRNWYNLYQPYQDVYSLVAKRVEGVALTPMQWFYQYGNLAPAYAELPYSPQYKTTTIVQPGGDLQVSVFGKDYGVNDGQLAAVETWRAGQLVRRVSHTYVSNDEIAALPFPDFMGYQITFDEGPDAWGATVIRPQRTTTIDQDGSTTNSIVDSYDALARPLNVTKFSSLGSSKTEGTGYLDDLTQWVLGQVATFTVNGIQVSRTDYDTNVLPWKNYTFGKLQSTMGYYADGTLAMVKDGRDLTTTLSSWKRGIPQSIAHPDTTNESAVVNDSGWITSVTDENGYSTGYGYDAMGRIASIAYPTGDATLWNTTTFTFAPVSGPEYGIPAGHWRQVVSTGNARKVTYFDAMWRPLVDESYDQGDVNTTLSQAVKRYDVSGHLVYQSYPLRFLSDYSVPTKGIRTSYDALDRATRVEQDSELGVLATSTEYLAGFQIRTTNPRLQSTTVSYLAYDQPSTEFPVAISHPEGAYTNILRNGLGKPTSLTRRNADSSVALTRYYVYDAQQQLCKTVEPETAATVMDYDAAGNLAWSASGLNTLSTTACETESVPTAVKVTRTYDARNRLSTLLFPDGNGTQSWGYTPDGLPSVITTLNDEGLTSAVNGYTYNKRRLLTGESLRQPALSYTWALGYGYNGNGHMASHTSPGLTVDYAPNALGQPTQAGTYATGVSYFANGAMAQFTYGNGIVHTLVQNTRGLPDQSRDAYGGTAVHDDSYDFDANGNVLAISDALPGNRGNRDMTYDGLDRLTGTTSPMFGVASYGYDVLDNLKTLKVTGGTQARDNTYVYDASWRLTNVANTVGGSSVIGLGYDVQGNLANKNGQLYRFDFGNRLRDATGKEHYRYDGYGRRVQATHPTLGDIYSMYGSDGVLRYQHDYRTHKVSSYVYLNGSLVARVSDATPVVPPPILSAPTINSSGSFAVNWSAVEGANRYHLEESVNSGTWTQVVDTPGLSWSASGKPNGIYRYRARSCQMECSAFSTIATTTVDLMPTTVPTLSTPAYSTTGSFTVAWTAEALATRYELDEQVDGGSWTQIQNAAATSQAIGGKPSGSYGYRVRACNSTACAAWSATATVTVEMAPTVPPSLTVPAQGLNGAYVVSWSAVAGATSYTLQESADGGAWTTAYSGGAQSLALAGKVTGSYAYRVQACNLGGCSDVSASGTVQVIYPPASASTLSAPAQSTNGGYIVSWTTVATATSYQLEESSNGGAWTLSQNASSISSAFSSKAAGTYSYRVKACNAAGCGPTSAATSVQVIYQPVSSPVVSVPAQSTNGAYTVSWTAVATSASYQLEESVNGAAWALSQDAFAISAAYASKAAGSYSYRVKACNAAGCGPTSATASVQVIYPPSSAPTPTGPGQSSSAYTVSWTGVATATSYQLEENTNGGAWTLRQNAAATSMAFTGKAVATYGYRVKACNAAGCGPMSGTITVQVVSIPTAAPALTVPASSSTGTYTVSWTAITGATSYQFAERPQGGSWLLNQNVAGTTKAITQTTGTYEYKVTACNAAGCGPSSAIKSITVQLPGIPAIPAAPSVATGTYCTVSWGSMANTTSYRLIDANNSVGTFATTQVTAVCAAPYRVAACNANGCSAYSDPSVSDMQMMRRAP